MKSKSIVIAIALFALISCEKTEEETVENIVADAIETNALSAVISGTFSNMTSKELAYGTFGVLYCESGENGQSVFDNWKNGTAKPECQMKTNGSFQTGGAYTIPLENLNPMTEYSFCLFYQSEDDSRRDISKVSTFKTKAFQPEFSSSFSDTGLHSTRANGTLVLANRDVAMCTIGFIISQNSIVSVEGEDETVLTVKEVGNDGNFSVLFDDLRAGTTFFCRPFVKINATGEYTLGDECTFATLSPDFMKVDLGLSVIWADRDLKAASPEEVGAEYAWGHLVSNGTGKRATYIYWNETDNSYYNIGEEISGTKYDVAHYLLGDKWRMPTKAEFEELAACEKQFGLNAENGMVEHVTFSGNGHTITINDTPHWSGTLKNEPDFYGYFRPYTFFYVSPDDDDPFKDAVREYERPIRPVWDPNMQ